MSSQCLPLHAYPVFVSYFGGPGKFTEETPYGKFVPRGFHPVQCEAMREYALSLCILKKNILMQNFSSDTIGEAFFVKKMFLDPNKWYKNIIVTNECHVDRARRIYEVVLGRGCHTHFESVTTSLDSNKEIPEREKSSKERFERDYGAIEPGDSHAFESALYQKHDIYSKIPESLRPKVYSDFFISL